MVIENGERMTAPVADREVALEVHLPQLVGLIALEALIGSGMLVSALLKLAVAAHDRGDGAQCRYGVHGAAQHMSDLAAAPGIVVLRANAQHFCFHRQWRARRARMRPAPLVGESSTAFRPTAPEPFVARLSADPEAPAQLTSVRSPSHRQPHKLLPLVHDRQLPPWH